jgi:hypothetical protein
MGMSRGIRLAAIAVTLLSCPIAGAQEWRTTIETDGSLACRNKADIEMLFDNIVKPNVQAYQALAKGLAASGPCTPLKQGTAVVVLEAAKYPKSRNLYVARIRQAGAEDERYVSTTAFPRKHWKPQQ